MNNSAPLPAVIILLDWDDENTYEKLRATLLAMHGYVAFAADISLLKLPTQHEPSVTKCLIRLENVCG